MTISDPNTGRPAPARTAGLAIGLCAALGFGLAAMAADLAVLPGVPMVYSGQETDSGQAEQVRYVFDRVIVNDAGRLVVEGTAESGPLGLGDSPATLIVDAGAGTATLYPAAHDNLAGCNGRYIGDIAADWSRFTADWVDFAGNVGPRLELTLQPGG